jgi:hypothetical protein
MKLNDNQMGGVYKNPYTLGIAGDRNSYKILKESGLYIYAESSSGHLAVFKKLVFDNDWGFCKTYYFKLVVWEYFEKKELNQLIEKYQQKWEQQNDNQENPS